ncbi:DHA2 family efflux MFS transporter permease subunit [Thalassobaculum sp. OXR-137]|uniref:DHA2 family efflux MFS transporter permease subunit n=1 Tax=Thalassobaculum sp. OXR-137 TaxID=3100173 RepID=UPI002AC99CBA|nr:DHA2 family efflux MFS transporter permease subunit [Thalassobaculum sp. OXR-137]WPZ35151.1 DHA2 family efflux MFS transporter permease subunit [Thalassobaculum sp. OXR-137]
MTDTTPGSGAGAAPAARRKVNPWIIAPVVAMAAFMEVLDLSIANVALPHIAGSLSASRDQSTWILTSYLVTNAIILPLSGWLSTVIGRKKFYMMCIAGFGIASLLCGMAPTLELLIIARTLQGLTGGGLQPVSQAILADTFPPHQRAMAFAMYGISVVFAPAIGPTLGGWITDNFSWHWIFLVNVPVSIVLWLLVEALIEDPEAAKEEVKRRRAAGIRIDYIGFALLALGLGCLQILLDKGQEEDWFSSHFIVIMALLAVVGIIAFVIWELGSEDPIVDLSLLRDRNFAIANAMMFMLGFVLMGSTALLPLFVQSLFGYTAMQAGMVLSPGGFMIMAAMPLVGRLVGVVDARYLIMFGLLCSASGLILMSGFTLEADFWTIAHARMVQAAGLGFLFIPISSMAYVGLPPGKNNQAAALINLSRNLGGSVGIALLSTWLVRGTQAHRADLAGHVSPLNAEYLQQVAAVERGLLANGADPSRVHDMAVAVIARSMGQQAELLGFLNDFTTLAIVFFALVPAVIFLRRPNRPPGR